MELDVPRIFDQWLVESETQLRAVFERARELSPSVLVLDHVEVAAPSHHALAASSTADRRVLTTLSAQSVGPLLRLRFGYVVAGSILPMPRQGNPRPRLLRDVEHQALLNSLGLPSDTTDARPPRATTAQATDSRTANVCRRQDT